MAIRFCLFSIGGFPKSRARVCRPLWWLSRFSIPWIAVLWLAWCFAEMRSGLGVPWTVHWNPEVWSMALKHRLDFSLFFRWRCPLLPWGLEWIAPWNFRRRWRSNFACFPLVDFRSQGRMCVFHCGGDRAFRFQILPCGLFIILEGRFSMERPWIA